MKGIVKMKQRKQRSDTELLSALKEHVKYEHDMLKFTAKMLRGSSNLTAELKNALLESFLLHFRILFDFYRNWGQLDDDMWASDFCNWCPVAYDKELSERLNKCLAHLTYARQPCAVREPPWDVKEMRKKIENWEKEFRAKLPPQFKTW